MGCYVNPPDMEKEMWLALNALPFSGSFADVPQGFCAVCLVQNGFFTAAGVCFNEREFEDFNDPYDYRPKEWFIALIDDLKTVSPLAEYFKDYGVEQ